MVVEASLVAALIVVSFLWGITNPLMKKYSEGMENVKANSYVLQTFSELKLLASRPKYVASFLLNQVGAVVFMTCLSSAELSLAVPLTNGLTSLVTTLTGQFFLKEKALGLSGWLGIILLTTGISLCVAGKT